MREHSGATLSASKARTHMKEPPGQCMLGSEHPNVSPELSALPATQSVSRFVAAKTSWVAVAGAVVAALGMPAAARAEVVAACQDMAARRQQ